MYQLVLFCMCFPCARWHDSNPERKGFQVALQIQFEPSFDRCFDGNGEVKTHEPSLHMNDNDELWTLINHKLDFLSKFAMGKTIKHALIDSSSKQLLWESI